MDDREQSATFDSQRPETAGDPEYRAAKLAVVAADRVFRGGLRSGGSAFSTGLKVWSATAVEDLRRSFVEKPDTGGDDFLTKLRRQLSGASDEAIVLVAELLYLNVLPLSERQIGRSTKRQILDTVLSWAQAPTRIPAEFDEAMAGFINGGMAFLSLRWAQLQFLIQLVGELIAMEPAAREGALSDPWAFQAVCTRVSGRMGNQKARAQVQVLLHLMFPAVFIDSASVEHKKLMRDTFASKYLQEPTGDLDRDIGLIKGAIEAETGVQVNFYGQPWVSHWRPTAVKDEQRGWLVQGANVDGRNYIATWLADGFCSMSWHEVAALPAKASKKEIADAVEEAMAEASAQERATARSQLYKFLTEMRPDDLVVTVDGNDVYLGTVASDAYHVPDGPGEIARRRSVQWSTVDRLVSRTALPEQARVKLSDRRTVAEITSVISVLLDAFGPVDSDIDVTEGIIVKGGTVALDLPAATSALAESLLFPIDWLETTISVLRRRRQVILYGPPGTGKTHTARAVAEHVAPGNVRLVQFHPSYTYEDFFEGYRPVLENGVVSFDVVDGPFKRLAREARENPAQPYVLIIDEINRANLAKVFGELYFLLEYRDTPIITQYSKDEPFELPKNVYIIGTMNTTDRSIALVDAALRRRFAFCRLAPDTAPVAGLLRLWLAENKLSALAADLLDALNKRLADADRAIGPSYLMDSLIDDPGELSLVWDTQILPLLEDQLLGSGQDVAAHFGLEALLAEVASGASAASP